MVCRFPGATSPARRHRITRTAHIDLFSTTCSWRRHGHRSATPTEGAPPVPVQRWFGSEETGLEIRGWDASMAEAPRAAASRRRSARTYASRQSHLDTLVVMGSLALVLAFVVAAGAFADFWLGERGNERIRARMVDFYDAVGRGDWSLLYRVPAQALLRFLERVLGSKLLSIGYVWRVLVLSASMTLLFARCRESGQRLRTGCIADAVIGVRRKSGRRRRVARAGTQTVVPWPETSDAQGHRQTRAS